jgi:hypothetical protein
MLEQDFAASYTAAWRRDSAVGITMVYRLDRREELGSFPSRTGDFCLHTVYTGLRPTQRLPGAPVVVKAATSRS